MEGGINYLFIESGRVSDRHAGHEFDWQRCFFRRIEKKQNKKLPSFYFKIIKMRYKLVKTFKFNIMFPF